MSEKGTLAKKIMSEKGTLIKNYYVRKGHPSQNYVRKGPTNFSKEDP